MLVKHSCVRRSTLFVTAVTMLLGAIQTGLAQQVPRIISAEQARDFVGSEATVCATVVSTHYAATSRGRPTFLNFEKPYPNQPFTVVIWGEDRSQFSGAPEVIYRGKRVCVTGLITTYRGKPQIIVRTPTAIRIMEDSENKDAAARCVGEILSQQEAGISQFLMTAHRN